MSNGQQFIQWLTDEKFAQVEPAEQLFDGKQDMVIPANGHPIPMHMVGKAFIMLPDRGFAMESSALRQMYPKERVVTKRREPAKSYEDYQDKSQSREIASEFLPEIQPPIQRQIVQETITNHVNKKPNGFVNDLLSKAKMKSKDVHLSLKIELPSSSFYSMLLESFTEDVIDSMIDELVNKVDENTFKEELKKCIISILQNGK